MADTASRSGARMRATWAALATMAVVALVIGLAVGIGSASRGYHSPRHTRNAVVPQSKASPGETAFTPYHGPGYKTTASPSPAQCPGHTGPCQSVTNKIVPGPQGGSLPPPQSPK